MTIRRKQSWLDVAKATILWLLASGGVAGGAANLLSPAKDQESREATSYWFGQVQSDIRHLENEVNQLKEKLP